MEKKKYYITTAIAYTSKKPHVGNSYEIVLTDAIARFKRLQGYDVFFSRSRRRTRASRRRSTSTAWPARSARSATR